MRLRRPKLSRWSSIASVGQGHEARHTVDYILRWYERYRDGGIDALADHRSRPARVWNRIPDDVRGQIIDLALERPELSPRELAVRFTDEQKYFVSEASVYRLLKAHDLITSPAYVVIKAADEFKDKTTAINQLWQTDFTLPRDYRLGLVLSSTVLDDFSRYIVAWRLGQTMVDTSETALRVLRELEHAHAVVALHNARPVSGTTPDLLFKVSSTFHLRIGI